MPEPIRVLQSVPSMGHGGIEHFLMNLYRAIDKDRVQFDFVYRVAYDCVFDEEIRSLGGRIFRFPDPEYHPVASRKFYRRLLTEHPKIKVVHEHRSGCDGFFGLMREATRQGIPCCVIHSHSTRKGWLKNPVKDFTDAVNAPRLDKFANTFIACSDLAANYLFGRCPAALEASVVMPNAIDLEAFRFSEEASKRIRDAHGIAMDSLVIGHIGRFVPEKNQMFLLDVLARLRNRNVKTDLLLLGDGPMRAEVASRAESMGLKGCVHLVGNQSDTASFYSAMNVYCMPSLFEGLPVTCVEAQAAGVPMLLSSNITKMADICGHTTFLELEEGASAWADAVWQTFEKGKYNGQEALTKAGYDMRITAKRFEQLYLTGEL